MSVVLSVKKLQFTYYGEKIFKNVNFSLSEGNLLFICGLSGHGKSTLLRLLIGLEKPDSGSIRIFNQDINQLPEDEFNRLKSRVGFVFQNSALLSTLTVENNLKLPLVYHNLASRDEIEEMIENTLEKLLLKEHRHKFPGELSLGLQKRTAMARAIITNPSMIFMDEPTTGLDSISRGVYLSLIENVRILNNVAMIMVTNDLLIAREMGGEIGILKDGILLEPMAYQQLKNSPDRFVQALLEEEKLRSA
ncbi:MAG: ATP-binding cassette domain-containing protein [Fibrobacteria bacterium]|nr:ATP-binding cassette domain-containing protein [Fibrobacteria bacterium]